jgi:hypothetical protein
VLFGLYECREDTDEDLLLVRIGLPGAADDLARIVYAKVKPLHLSSLCWQTQRVPPSPDSGQPDLRPAPARGLQARHDQAG